jgi:hypothetical protein
LLTPGWRLGLENHEPYHLEITTFLSV